MARTKAMRVTTVRFGSDLWALLDQEAARVGVSVSQYVREAALARAVAAAAARGDAPFDLLAGAVREVVPADAREGDVERALAGLARAVATERREEAEAVRRESRQAVRTAEARRDRAASMTQNPHARSKG
jgi:hypothetical protein